MTPAQPKIPFHRPHLGSKELEYVTEAVTSRALVGDGPFTKKCGAFLEHKLLSPRVLMTPSCTAALEMASVLADLKPGDEVIMPSYTFVSTANAVVLRGATPVFVDIRPDTLNIDEKLVRSAVTSRTRAISVVHYAGVPCEMTPILKIAKDAGALVIEDAAQGVGSKYRGKQLGTIGDLGCFSFHETKNFVAGEGGAISVNRSELFERAEIVREKGTNRNRFLRGQVDKYTWVDIGSSWLPSDIACAFLLAQLEAMDEIIALRRTAYQSYVDGFAKLAQKEAVKLPVVPTHCETNFHIFHIVSPNRALADGLIRTLREAGIGASSHYVPLHTSPMGEKVQTRKAQLPVTEALWDRVVRLPLHTGVSEQDVQRTVGLVEEFFKK